MFQAGVFISSLTIVTYQDNLLYDGNTTVLYWRLLGSVTIQSYNIYSINLVWCSPEKLQKTN